MLIRNGVEPTTLEGRHGDRRGTLRLDDPRTKSSLAALDLSGVDVADFRTFSNRLHRDADAWLRSKIDFAPRGRIDKHVAARLYAHELGGGRS